MSYSPPSEPISAAKKPQSHPWSHQETIHLIKAYDEKWNALKRGQLRANQWEEIANAVAGRCGLAADEAKSAVQCRHKMEKLRRRYRSERQNTGGVTSWPYYQVMDALLNGASPAVTPWKNHKIRNTVLDLEKYEGDEEGGDEDDDEEEEEEEEEEARDWSRLRRMGHILKRPPSSGRWISGCSAKRRREEEEEEEVTVAAEIRRFAERVVGMEKRRMEMTREMEWWRMEMENKRMEMILDSEKKILEAIATKQT